MNCDGSQARWGTASLTFWFCMIIIQKLKDPQKHETCQLSCWCITLSARAALLYTKYHSKFTRKNVTINKNRCPVVGFAQTCGRHWCVFLSVHACISAALPSRTRPACQGYKFTSNRRLCWRGMSFYCLYTFFSFSMCTNCVCVRAFSHKKMW